MRRLIRTLFRRRRRAARMIVNINVWGTYR